MSQPNYWGYRHSDGSLILKPWMGDHKDYTEDIINNPFIQAVVPPFEASNSLEAGRILGQRLVEAPQTSTISNEAFKRRRMNDDEKYIADLQGRYQGVVAKLDSVSMVISMLDEVTANLIATALSPRPARPPGSRSQ